MERCHIKKLPSPSPTSSISNSSLPILFPASEAEVSLLLNTLPNKQCELDPIPTSLLKDCASVLVPVITKIINLSLSSGNFPMVFKHFLVTPLLKEANLEKGKPIKLPPHLQSILSI